MYACHFCKAAVEEPRTVFRATTCASCKRDLKVCLNCRFHSPGAHWDCAESVDEMVRDKDRGNFCTFFSFRSTGAAKDGNGKPDGQAQATQAKRKLDKLFGDES
jgi:hypothetical protein